jgi:hypothetical protein
MKILLLASIILQFSASLARSAEVYKPVLEVTGKINDLILNDELSVVRVQSSGMGYQSSIVFAGNFNRSGWTLKIEDQEITLKEGGAFYQEVILSAGKNTFHFTAEGTDSRKESLEVTLRVESMVAPANAPLKQEKEQKLFLFPGFGVSSIQTVQTGKPDYSTLAVTAKISANYRIVPRKWDIGLSAFGTAFQISKSSDVSARYLGVNSRLGYLFPALTTDLFLSLYAGYYFTSTFVTNDFFGYKNLGGPQIYPAIRKVLSSGHVISGYFKFSPVSSSFSLLTLSNREIAGGVAYSVILPNSHSVAATLDYSNIRLDLDRFKVSTTSLTLGLQYGL